MLIGWVALASSSGCGSCSADVPARGSISVAWSITGADQKPATCDQVGASTVVLRLRTRAGDVSVASFACGRSPGTTEVVAGPYEVAFELHAIDGATLAAAPGQSAVAVSAGQVTTLAPVVFALDAKGILAIAIATPPNASNCKAPADGAGITGNTITLEHSFGSCAPVTFSRTRGGTPTGTYTVNCGSPETASCIEKDETLTVPSMAPGAYVIRIRSAIGGAKNCWNLDGVLEVPPGSTVTRTLNLTHLGAAGC